MTADGSVFAVHGRVTDGETPGDVRPDRSLTRRLMSFRPQPRGVVPTRYAATTGGYARVHSPCFYGLRTHTAIKGQEVCGEVQV